MKKVLLILLMISANCYAQSKFELNITMGYQPSVVLNEGRSDGKGNSVYLGASSLYNFKNYFKAGLGINYNLITGYKNLSPVFLAKLIYPNDKIHPYLKGEFGVNFMSSDKRTKTGSYLGAGAGINLELNKKMYFDLGVSYATLNAKDFNQMSNSQSTTDLQYSPQSFSMTTIYFGISYGF